MLNVNNESCIAPLKRTQSLTCIKNVSIRQANPIINSPDTFPDKR